MHADIGLVCEKTNAIENLIVLCRMDIDHVLSKADVSRNDGVMYYAGEQVAAGDGRTAQ